MYLLWNKRVALCHLCTRPCSLAAAVAHARFVWPVAHLAPLVTLAACSDWSHRCWSHRGNRSPGSSAPPASIVICKAVVVVYFKALSRHSLAVTEDNNDQPQSCQPVTFIVAPCISMIQSLLYTNLRTYIYYQSLKHFVHLIAPTCFDTQRVIIRELYFPG
jgi:hypothetical protein